MDSLQVRQDCATPFVFYSCSNGFRGCCSINPCGPNNECPAANSPEGSATTTADPTLTTTKPHTATTAASSSSSTKSATTSSTTLSTTSETSTTPTSSATPAATQPPPPTASDHSNSGSSAGTIAGSVVGGLLALIGILCLVLFLLRRRRRRDRQRNSTLARRESMKAIEGDADGGVFAPYGGFYRGDKPLSASPDGTPDPDHEEPSQAPYSDTPSTPKSLNKPMYRIVNPEAAAATVSSPSYPSQVPSVNIDPVQLDSTTVVPHVAEMEAARALAEMADTSRPLSIGANSFPRWSQHARTSSTGTTGYKPYRPSSAVTSVIAANVSTAGLQPSPSADIISRTNSNHAMSWNDHSSATAQGPPDDLASNFIPSPLQSPIINEAAEATSRSPK